MTDYKLKSWFDAKVSEEIKVKFENVSHLTW
jgi:hypothetical protein